MTLENTSIPYCYLPNQSLLRLTTKKTRIKKLDEGLDNFSDQDTAIQQLILNAASGFSINPRELKRFINSFRFNYFVSWARKSRNLPCPSVEQLTRWTVLSLKWPDVVRWLQWGAGTTAMIKPRRKKDKTNSTNRRLNMLEDIAEGSHNQTDWQNKLEECLRVKSDDGIPWIKDENLWLFFRKEVEEFSKSERLSANAGQGLY